MSSPTIGRAGTTARAPGSAANDIALRFEHVSKVFCGNLKLARNYAIRDILWPRRDRPSRLRQGEWVGLRDLSFEVKKGQTVLILGLPGSGKSPLADLMTGRRAPDTGTILRRGSVGAIGDGKFGQNPLMKLHEYVRLMASLQGVQAADLSDMTETILEWTGLTAHRETTIFDLPARLMKPLARVGSLLAQHDIYVFDNYAPFGDGDLDRRLAARFDEIQSKRTCVVLSRGPQVPPRADHVLILHGGEILYGGEPATTIHVYDQFVDHTRSRLKRRGAGSGRAAAGGSGRGGALHHQPTPPVDEALVLIRDLLGSGGPGWLIDSALERLSSHDQPFLIGPCLTNVTWEVLFWLPFLKWMRRELGPFPPATALSRGLVADWYEPVASAFLDIYDLIPPAEFEARNEARAREGSLKQLEISDFERELLELAAARCGLQTIENLHPSVLLGLSAQIWRGRTGLSDLGDRSIYERLPVPVDNLNLDLPPDYVAVCFNFTKHFPDVPENRMRVADAIRAARDRTPVVVLGAHDWLWSEGYLATTGQDVRAVDPNSDPRRRGRVEAAVIGHARAAIGTVNGPVTLAPFSGVPATCLYPTTGGMVEFNVGALRQAAERLGETILVTAPVTSMTAAAMSRWVEDVLEGRPSTPGGMRHA